ncbi:MAG: Rrf2 family transcriptional regulator [Thermoguttaceae bacterium]|nr:Rrf2 family transcriptional regulator [Thermoguttaceae bacterium]
MKLSQSTAYAIFAAIHIAAAGRGGSVCCAQLAESGRLPQRYLLQILRALVRRGILRSSRGGNGGFSLAQDPSDVSLLDLIEAIEGPVSLHLSLDGGTMAVPSLFEGLEKAEAAIRDELRKITIAQLIENHAKALGRPVTTAAPCQCATATLLAAMPSPQLFEMGRLGERTGGQAALGSC